VSPKFFYDPLGSRLFDAITELAEYYPTRTEAAIFARHGAAIADAALRAATGAKPVLVDLGAGNCAKAARLFAVLAPQRYVAVDIGLDFLRTALTRMQQRTPELQLVGVGLDFSTSCACRPAWSEGLRWCSTPGPASATSRPPTRCACCGRCASTGAGGALLIGVDLVKPTPLLEAAYDDDAGRDRSLQPQPAEDT
jgi:L-histidine N-alpha-methyltransferase